MFRLLRASSSTYTRIYNVYLYIYIYTYADTYTYQPCLISFVFHYSSYLLMVLFTGPIKHASLEVNHAATRTGLPITGWLNVLVAAYHHNTLGLVD